MLDLIVSGFANFVTPMNLLITIGSLFLGITFGALPGFSATMGVALVVPFSYWLKPESALILLSGVYCGAVYGGSISAILLGIPGTPASVPTSFDGLAMTRKGKMGRGLFLVTYASSFGGFWSAVALMFLSPLLAIIALRVGPPEQMALAIFGLSVVSMLSAGSLFKGLMVGFGALLLATIGQSPLNGYPRFTFGNYRLLGGLSVVPVLIGIFSLPEVVNMVETKDEELGALASGNVKYKVKLADLVYKPWLMIKSTIIGIVIGIIPAAGPDIAAFISYNDAKKNSRHPEEFGHGAEEGIIASEAANNGVTGGSLIPLLTLGIPGSAPAAIYLGAMYIHGMRPGPAMFNQNAKVTYTLFAGFVIINILMYFIGMLFCRFAKGVVTLKKYLLAPMIVVLSVVGSYAIQSNMFDVVVMFAAGLVGTFLVRNGFPLSPVALALLLGPMLEESIAQTISMTRGNMLLIFKRPLTLVFFGFTLVSLAWPALMAAVRKNRAAATIGKAR